MRSTDKEGWLRWFPVWTAGGCLPLGGRLLLPASGDNPATAEPLQQEDAPDQTALGGAAHAALTAVADKMTVVPFQAGRHAVGSAVRCRTDTICGGMWRWRRRIGSRTLPAAARGSGSACSGHRRPELQVTTALAGGRKPTGLAIRRSQRLYIRELAPKQARYNVMKACHMLRRRTGRFQVRFQIKSGFLAVVLRSKLLSASATVVKVSRFPPGAKRHYHTCF